MISILYVDDEPALLEIAKLFLERSGNILVDTEESVPNAIDRIRAGTYDAIISDYQMPEMDGIALLQAVRKEFPTIPFIIFTGKGRYDVVIEALNCGADNYLQKGGDPRSQFSELIRMINHAVEKRQSNDTNRHLLRLYAVVSATNRAVLRVREYQTLLVQSCRIAVEEGGFLMVWIGLVDAETHAIRPVAASGYEKGSTKISDSVKIPEEMGMTSAALRDGRPIINNDISTDPRIVNFQNEAAERGYRSSAGIPLRTEKGIIGVIRFYSGEIDFFHEKEIKQLEQLAGDIGFAIDLITTSNNRA